jgi:peptidoglycan/xylan/chitin deacetylase (PgdA/CDA1 family)
VSPTWTAPLSVTPDALERQLDWLACNGFRALTFRDVVGWRQPGRTVAVTFDDAFASVLTIAQPILASLGMPATVFAPTSFMSSRQQLGWPGIDHWASTPHAAELEGMSWEDLGVLSEQGWEIGSHTRTHPHLTRLDEDALHEELLRSREEATSALGVPCTSIAYPYGDVDARVASAARAAGYLAGGCLSSRLTPHGHLLWPRVGIYHVDTFARFRVKSSRAMRLLRASRLWPASGVTSHSPQ